MPRSIPLHVESLETREVPAASFDTLPIFPFADAAALDNVRAIAFHGQQLGRRDDVFMKIGDSNTDFSPFVNNTYLKPLGAAGYNPALSGLAAFGQNLVNTWATYQTPVGGVFNSFNRPSTTAFPGFTLLNVLPNVAGEIAATNAGVALIMLGTNDLATYGNPVQFQTYLQQLVNTLVTAGVVPILSTIPDTHYNGNALVAQNRAFNQVIANVAGDNHIPLWNLFVEESSLPYSGLDSGGVHLTYSDSFAGNFTPVGLLFGQNVHNLGALMMLTYFREQVIGVGSSVVPPFAFWNPIAVGQSVYAVGRGEGQGPTVSVYDTATGQELDRITPFEASFSGGVRVAMGDVNHDGIPDLIVGAGPGGGPVVKVYSGADGSLLTSFFAFEPSFRGGVSSLAVADLDGDGAAEIVVGAGIGGAPVVAVYHGGDFAQTQRFYAFDPSFRGGVNVAAGTFAGIGPVIVAGAGVGGGPQVAVFAYGSTNPVLSFFAFDPSYRGGVVVAAGDFNGDGREEVAVGTASGSTRVQVIDLETGAVTANFFGGPPASVAGVRFGSTFRVAGQPDELLIGNGPGDAVRVQAYSASKGLETLVPNDPNRAYGVYVG